MWHRYFISGLAAAQYLSYLVVPDQVKS